MVELVRKSSETPNITNRDDACLARYAYGGDSGVVKNFGNELSYEYANNVFKLNSGRIVLMGWEVDIDEGGHTIQLDSSSGTIHHTVYLEVNLMTETAEIKYEKGAFFPSIDKGDDLTKFPNGTARLLLYHFSTLNGALLSITKGFSTLPSLKDIEERLEKLGFKQGSISLSSGFAASENIVTRQGNYVIGKIVFDGQYRNFSTGKIGYNKSVDIKVGSLSSQEFFPKDQTLVGFRAHYQELDGDGDNFEMYAYIDTAGDLYVHVKHTALGSSDLEFSIYPYEIMFGYEANPL